MLKFTKGTRYDKEIYINLFVNAPNF